MSAKTKPKHTMAQSSLYYLHAVGAPAAQLAGCVDVRLQLVAELGQVQKQVLRGADDWLGACQLAARVQQVGGVHEAATLVTLVAARILQGVEP
jgi:hypothetical protein